MDNVHNIIKVHLVPICIEKDDKPESVMQERYVKCIARSSINDGIKKVKKTATQSGPMQTNRFQPSPLLHHLVTPLPLLMLWPAASGGKS